MKVVYLILLPFLFIFFSCKEKKKPISENVPMSAPTPEKTDIITHDTLLQEEINIRIIPNKFTEKLWELDIDTQETEITNATGCNNGNIFVTARISKKYSFQYFQMWGINPDGGLLGTLCIKSPKGGTYNYYSNCFVIPQKKNFPVFYVLAKKDKNEHYASDSNKSPEKLVLSLDANFIDRFYFNDSISDFSVKRTSLKQLLEDFVLENKIIYVHPFKLIRNFDGNIFLHGQAHKLNKNYGYYPFIILLDENMNVIHSHIYDDDEYAYTEIENIKQDKNGHFLLTGKKEDAADGSYYYTHIKFEVDANLDFLTDMSDEEPYYSFYRGPSAPEYTSDEEEEEETEEETEEEEESKPKEEPSTIVTMKMCHNENQEKPYYTITFDKKAPSETVLKKINLPDSTVLLSRNIYLTNNCTPKVISETSDGGFALAYEKAERRPTENDYDKDSWLSDVILFRFDSKGNMVQQIETPSYTGRINNLNIFQSQDKLILVFVAVNKYFDGDWHFPQEMKVVAYPLETNNF